MDTVLNNLNREAERIRSLLEELLKHSSIDRWNYNDRGVIWLGGDYRWRSLDEEGRRIQAKTLEEYRRFYSILKTLLREAPKDTLSKLHDSNLTVLSRSNKTE